MSVQVYSAPGQTEVSSVAFFEWKSIDLSYELSLTCGDVLILAKLKGRGRPFLKGARRGATLWDYLQEHLVVIRDEKVSPFVKFEIILPLVCFLLDPLPNKHCRRWISMINLWIDSVIDSIINLWIDSSTAGHGVLW